MTPNHAAITNLLTILYGPGVTLRQKLAALKDPDAKLNLATIADHGLDLSGEAVRFSLIKDPSRDDLIPLKQVAERMAGGEAHGWLAYLSLSYLEFVTKEHEIEKVVVNAQAAFRRYLDSVEKEDGSGSEVSSVGKTTAGENTP